METLKPCESNYDILCVDTQNLYILLYIDTQYLYILLWIDTQYLSILLCIGTAPTLFGGHRRWKGLDDLDLKSAV